MRDLTDNVLFMICCMGGSVTTVFTFMLITVNWVNYGSIVSGSDIQLNRGIIEGLFLMTIAIFGLLIAYLYERKKSK